MKFDTKFTVRWKKLSCSNSWAWQTRKCWRKAIPGIHARIVMTFFLDVAGSGRKFHWHSESGTRLRWTKQGWHIDSSEGRSRVLVFIALQRHGFQVCCPCCTTMMQRGCRQRQVCPQLVRVIWVAHISFAAAGWMYWTEAEGRYRHAIISIAEAYIYSACVNHLTYIYI